jgi:hypothetical protein
MARRFPIEHSRLRLRWLRFRVSLRERKRPNVRREIIKAALELGMPDAIPPNWNRDGTLRR